jgi:hypothetical protein
MIDSVMERRRALGTGEGRGVRSSLRMKTPETLVRGSCARCCTFCGLVNS